MPDREEDREEVRVLWRKYGAIEADKIGQRSKEIVLVVKDEGGHIVALSTARSIQARFLNNQFFYEYRCFISPDFRIPGLDTALSVRTKAFLQKQEGSPDKYKGILMIIENEDLKNQRTKAVWPASGMVFAGYTSQGHHIRVGYFEGAKI